MPPPEATGGEAAVVLAGGSGSRMGRDKALLEAPGGGTLLERLLSRLAGPFEALAVSVPFAGPSAELAAAVARFEAGTGRQVRVLSDLRPGAGPLAGLESALEGLAAERVLLAAVDMPGPALDLIAALRALAAAPGALGCVPRWDGGLEPALAVYARELLPAARRLLDSGRRALRLLAAEPGVRILDLRDPEVRARAVGGLDPTGVAALFRSLNTPEDHEVWFRSAAGG